MGDLSLFSPFKKMYPQGRIKAAVVCNILNPRARLCVRAVVVGTFAFTVCVCESPGAMWEMQNHFGCVQV